jgi:putative aldouronate transport system permease protein
MGGLLTGNFEQSYLLGNAGNLSRSEIIPTYVMKMGLTQMRYSYATAIGLAQSVISLLLVLVSNFAAKKLSGTSLI